MKDLSGRSSTEELLEEKKQIEEDSLLKQIIEVMPGMLLILNSHRQILLANSVFLNIAQKSDLELLGLRPGEVLHCIHAHEGEDGCGTGERCKTCPALNAVFKSSLKSAGATIIEGKIETINGDLYVQVIAAPVKFPSINNEFVICNIFDISEKYFQEKEKNKIKEHMNLRARQASVSLLAAGIAHEINNPLMIIRGNIDLLKHYVDAEKITKEELLELISPQERAIERISKIISDMRKYTSTLGPKQNASVSEIIKNTINIIQEYFKNIGIKFSLNLTEEKDVVNLTNNDFQFVLSSIIQNAKEAIIEAKRQPGIITISSKIIEEQVILEIKDNGIGIKDEILKHAFEPFFSTKSPSNSEGVGLSLNIVQSMIIKTGGKIKIETEENSFTQVTISLPLQKQ